MAEQGHHEVGSWLSLHHHAIIEYHATTCSFGNEFCDPFGGPILHAIEIPVVLKEMLYIPERKEAEHIKDQRALNI